MMLFDDFQQHLHDLLTHLYDPIYQPPTAVMRILGAPPHPAMTTIQQIAKAAIAQLEPVADTPLSARSRRFYDLLAYRYIQELTQEETAHRLGITPRHLRREQQQAIYALAQQLWDGWQTTQEEQHQPPAPTPAIAADDQTTSWRAQIRQEVALLQQSTPGVVADVWTVLSGVAHIGEPLASQHGVTLRVVSLPQPAVHALLALIHPSALRQILLTAIEKLCQQMTTGEITLSGAPVERQVQMTITGQPFQAPQPIETDLMDELAAAHQGRVVKRLYSDHLRFDIWLPLVEKINVLVIDDNDDLVHFYQRYTALTRYEIVQVAQGREAVAIVKALKPAIIVLDVMLPDLDGWELLTQLHAEPTCRAIPVIVCSVVQRTELALALGAAASLAKPVGRLEFIAALDRVYTQVATKGLPD